MRLQSLRRQSGLVQNSSRTCSADWRNRRDAFADTVLAAVPHSTTCKRRRQQICSTSGNGGKATVAHYWLAHTILAIHATSPAASVRSAWPVLSDCSSSVLAVRRFNSRTITRRLWFSPPRGRRAGSACRRRHHDDVAVAIGRLHRIAGNFQREGMLVVDGGQRRSRPSPCRPESRHRRNGRRSPPARSRAAAPIARSRALSPINCTKLSIELLVAASALAIDSVDGQRSRPSAVTRLDLLKVVGSRPDFLASPEADSPARSASRSSAVQIWSWVSSALCFRLFGHGKLARLAV